MAKSPVLFGCFTGIQAWGSPVACNRVPRSMPLDSALLSPNLGWPLNPSTNKTISLPWSAAAVCALLVSHSDAWDTLVREE